MPNDFSAPAERETSLVGDFGHCLRKKRSRVACSDMALTCLERTVVMTLQLSIWRMCLVPSG